MQTVNEILSAALGYILTGASQARSAQGNRETQADAFWQRMRPYFISEVPMIETKPGSAETEIKTQEQLLFLIKDEQLFNDIAAQVTALKEAGITEKYIVQNDIARVHRIRIGDSYYTPKDRYDFTQFSEKKDTVVNDNMG